MFRTNTEDSAAKVIAIGALITTIMVGAWWGTDPVNVPKLFVLTITAICSASIFFVGLSRQSVKGNLALIIASCAFIFFALISTVFSTEPSSISFYGVFGRNNGFLSYFTFVVLFFLVTQYRKIISIKRLMTSFYMAGMINVVYCALSIVGIELIPWNNIFNTILGTFGNPNFVGAFLGLFATYLFCSFFNENYNLKLKTFNFAILLLTFYEITVSKAVQGLVVFVIGLMTVAFFFIRAKSQSKFILGLYSTLVLLISFLSTLGALQIGPLAKYIYKTSVSLRGEYWQAGITMGLNHPFFGVGMDSYGAWYRQTRDESAMVLPGAGTVTNAAHNVIIDIFASGGFPLLASYLVLLSLTIVSVFRVFKRRREFDFTFVSLVSVWIGYQAQSIISINQIGIAIWGWIFGGAIIAYERMDKMAVNTDTQIGVIQVKQKRKKNNTAKSQPSVVLATFTGALLGGLVALPPLVADVNWRSALGSGSQERLEQAIIQFPTTPNRLAEGIQIFSQNNLPDVARKYALILIDKYPNNFISWGAYAQLSDLTNDEKLLILKNLNRLDPLNPKFKINA